MAKSRPVSRETELQPSGAAPAEERDIYSAPAAPARATRSPRRRGLLLATLPSLLYFLLARWLAGPAVPVLLGLLAWSAAVILTFYGVGVFVWSSAAPPTWGRVALAVFLTAAWMRLVGYLVEIAMVVFGGLPP